MAQIITVANRKGGCSKTTTVKAIGEILSSVAHNKSVLLVDLDPQGNLTDWSQASTDNKNTIYEALTNRVKVTDNVIQHGQTYDLLPADETLSQIESELSGQVGYEHRLKEVLTDLEDKYDYIIIDTPPALGVLSILAFVATNAGVVIVTDSGMSATKGMNKLLDSLSAVRKFYNPTCNTLGVLLTCYNDHFCNDKQIASVTQGLLELQNTPFFETRIRTSVKIKESTTYALPLLEIAGDSKPMKDYEIFVDELLNMLDKAKQVA